MDKLTSDKADAAKVTSKPTDRPTVTPGNVDIEAFAHNIARMIEEGGKALAAYMKPREEGKIKSELAEDVADVIKTVGQVAEYWLADPQRAVELQASLGRAYLDLWAGAVKRMAGEPAAPAVKPDSKDKRFADPDWSQNQFFDFLKQAYLLTAQWAEHLVKDAAIDERTRQKAEFYIKQISNAISPSNFVLTNPELLRETLATNGENLARGMHLLSEDIKAGHGNLRISQTDAKHFEVGRNLAVTPGKVIFQNDLMQLLQYTPTTKDVLKVPLLIVPPWINKFYILDLTPEKSFIKWAVEQGITVFVISWVNPDAHLANKSFEQYMREGPIAALDVVEQVTGEKKIHTIGYCVGGTLLAITLAYLAKTAKKQRVLSATMFAAPVDFTYAGDLKIFVDEERLQQLETHMKEQGYLEASRMATAFNMLRSNDLVWPYVINNYMRGKKPIPFDILFWNADATRMPAANHSFYLRNCYLENNLVRGKMTIGGTKLDLKKVKVPIYNLATREDHIAPAKSVLYGSQYFGGPVKYVLAGSGHIAGVINPPGKPKYQYWTGAPPYGHDVEAWLATAKEYPGSWWPDWLKWLRGLDDKTVPARMIGGGKLKPIEDAPGSYVKLRKWE